MADKTPKITTKLSKRFVIDEIPDRAGMMFHVRSGQRNTVEIVQYGKDNKKGTSISIPVELVPLLMDTVNECIRCEKEDEKVVVPKTAPKPAAPPPPATT